MANLKKDLLTEIHKQFKTWPKAPRERQLAAAQYMAKNAPTSYEFKGMRIPQVRTSFKKIPLREFSRDEQVKAFSELWTRTSIFEEALFSLYWLEDLKPEELLQYLSFILRWSERIDNWAHADAYSHFLAKIYEMNPKNLEGFFAKWRLSSNPWFRRLSIVGILYYSRMRKKYPSFQKLIKSVEPLLFDEHYYVQKGVGWTLREIYNIYPRETFPFLLRNAENFHPAAWYAVTEKLSKVEKNSIKSKRFSKKGIKKNVR